MISSPSPPPVPDPTAIANAQTTSNKATATTQSELNATNQVTPYGNLAYTQSGTWADGTPQLTATQTLSPEQQNLYNLGTQTQANLGQIGVDQSSKVGNILNTPFDINSAIGTQQSDISRSLLDPVWNQRQAAQETQLANQGIQQGSEAYTNAMRDFNSQRNDAYNSALLADRGQATQEALTNRNQPLNEISALMSGSQVSQPNFVGTPQTNVAPTDVVGAYNMANNAAMNNYNQQMGQTNAIYGALGSAAGTLGGWGMMKYSDRRLKSDVRRIGTTSFNLPLYEYTIFGNRERGVMADEVSKVMPSAVSIHSSGYLMVNYSALGI